jgi:hypothetical protein
MFPERTGAPPNSRHIASAENAGTLESTHAASTAASFAAINVEDR